MDSIKILSLENKVNQRLHSKAPHSGHIHKGHSTVAYTATIPSKYETYVIENTEKIGFNNSSKRFDYEINENMCPGVGTYAGPSEFIRNTPSISRRGTGSFASKNKFISYNSFTDNPAPNIYEPKSTNDSKNNFSKAPVSRLFHSDVAVKLENKSSKLPAPNSYNVAKALGDSNYSHPQSSFKSNTTRDLNILVDQFRSPGPGQYSINKADNILNSNSASIQSPFKSTSKRDFIKNSDGPGPCDYNIGDNAAKLPMDPRFIRRHYLCLAASALKLPPTPPQPGPGQYNVSTNLSEPNHFMSSSMFTSNSSRWTKAGANIGIGISQGQSSGYVENPGPANYQPLKPKKQSFHYNVSNIWV